MLSFTDRSSMNHRHFVFSFPPSMFLQRKPHRGLLFGQLPCDSSSQTPRIFVQHGTRLRYTLTLQLLKSTRTQNHHLSSVYTPSIPQHCRSACSHTTCMEILCSHQVMEKKKSEKTFLRKKKKP